MIDIYGYNSYLFEKIWATERGRTRQGIKVLRRRKSTSALNAQVIHRLMHIEKCRNSK